MAMVLIVVSALALPSAVIAWLYVDLRAARRSAIKLQDYAKDGWALAQERGEYIAQLVEEQGRRGEQCESLIAQRDAAKGGYARIAPFGTAKKCAKCGSPLPKKNDDLRTLIESTMSFGVIVIRRTCQTCGWEVNELPLDAKP